MSGASALNNCYPELDNLRRMHPDYAQPGASRQWNWLLERVEYVPKEKEIELEI